MINLSRKVENIQISGIRRFYNKVMKVEGAISLTLGEPDFKIPVEIKEAMKEAIDEDKTTYTSNAGIEPLRREIAKYLNLNGSNYTMENICVTVGGSEAILNIFQTILNEGDKVLIPEIAYAAYESCIKIVGGTPIEYPLKKDLTIDLKKLKEIIKSEKPKAIILSYPCNPTGMLLSKYECDELYKMLKDEDILIISDEMYSSITFDKYYSLAPYDELRSRIILVGGFSKMFSMTGIRIGYVAAEASIMNEFIKVHQYNVSCAPSVGQYGALTGLRESMYHVEYIKNNLKERMEYVYSRLMDMGFEVTKPKGAFYIFPSIKKYKLSSEEFAEKLLNEARVAVVPGNAFGSGGEGYIRISYCYSKEQLKLALDNIESFIKTVE